jgi:hypothetical protein
MSVKNTLVAYRQTDVTPAENKKNLGVWDLIHNSLFSLQLTNWPDITVGWKCLPGSNTLAQFI